MLDRPGLDGPYALPGEERPPLEPLDAYPAAILRALNWALRHSGRPAPLGPSDVMFAHLRDMEEVERPRDLEEPVDLSAGVVPRYRTRGRYVVRRSALVSFWDFPRVLGPGLAGGPSWVNPTAYDRADGAGCIVELYWGQPIGNERPSINPSHGVNWVAEVLDG